MKYIIVKGEKEEIVRAYDGAHVFESESSANRRLMTLRNRIWQHAMEEAARLTSVIRGPGRQKLKELIEETEERVKEYRVAHIKKGYWFRPFKNSGPCPQSFGIGGGVFILFKPYGIGFDKYLKIRNER